MFSKIDNRILNKIITLNHLEKDFDVIIKYNNKRKVIRFLEKLSVANSIKNLPFINSLACKINYKDIYKLSVLKCVNYISSNSKVTSLIYDAKNKINYNNIIDLRKHNPKHTCVVIDTGVYPHVDLVLGKNRIIYFLDLINNKESMYDDNGHGTFVTGVLSGGGIVDKYSGIDNMSNIVVIKALNQEGETTTVKILESMQWVMDNKDKYNIRVVCMSFGSVSSSIEDPLVRGAEILWNNGIVVVCAAGNNGPNSATIMSPGVSRKIITVGSIDSKDNQVADFSSRGPTIVGGYKPDVVLPGVDIISISNFTNKEFYTTMSGTSVSTPMVAGVVSLLLNYNERYTPDQIKYMLVNSTIKINGDRNSEGFGKLDLSKLRLI